MNNSIPRILPPVYFLIGIVVMIILNTFVPIYHWLPSPWRYFGILLMVIGFLLSLAGGILFRRLGTPPRPGAKATVLITKGAFTYTRNPMYLGLIIMLVGVAILLGSLSPIVVIPIVIWILHSQFIVREEKWMENWFGDSYLEYKRKTPRWL